MEGGARSALAKRWLRSILVVFCCLALWVAGAESLLDTDGDGIADVLLRHDDGTWHHFAGVTNQASTRLGITRNPAFSWAAGGDFNGDGRGDVMLRGSSWVYYPLNGPRVIATEWGRPAMTRNAWRVVGVADITGDRNDDILLRNDRGAWIYYALDGARVIGSVRRPALPRGLDWQVAGLGDFKGIGEPSILLRHAQGGWKHLRIDGERVVEESALPTTDRRWRAVGVGDFDADSRLDVLLRHVSGRWRHESLPRSSADLPGLPDDWNWRLAGVGDFDGAGADDMLLRHRDGRWAMHAPAVDSGAAPEVALPVDQAWQLPTGPVHLPDLALREAVGRALGIAAGQPIWPRDLARLGELRATGTGIADLTGLEWATNLRTLALDGNAIDDIAPLAALTLLRTLILADNAIIDVSALGALAHLADLDLRGNRVSDLKPLEGVTTLERLDAAFNDIVDVAALANMDRLRVLDLSHNRIASVDPLLRNRGIGAGDRVDLRGNPLSPAGRTGVIALERRGASLSLTTTPLPSVAFPHELSLRSGFIVASHAADLDGDGDIDVVEADEQQNTIRWHRNLGGGRFATDYIDRDCSYARAVSAADLDDDGRVDVLATCELDHAVVWYANLGDAFSDPRVLTDVAYRTRAPVIAVDLDGDTAMDVLWGSDGAEYAVAWQRNLGNGAFSEPRVLADRNPYRRALTSADMDGDGDYDVVVASSEGELILIDNRGAGQFADLRFAGLIDPPTKSIEAADLDNDGDLDLATDGAVWLQNVGGSFLVREFQSVEGEPPVGDRVTLRHSSAGVEGCLNVDGGSAANRTKIQTWWCGDYRQQEWILEQRTEGTDAGRYRLVSGVGDGNSYCLDNAGEFFNGGRVWIYECLSDADRAVANQSFDLEPSGDGWEVVFSKGDATTRMAAERTETDPTGYVTQREDSSPATVWRFGPPPVSATAQHRHGPTDVAASDVDSDGDADLLYASYDDDDVAWRENLGDGQLGDLRHLLRSRGALTVQTAHFDSDTHPDLLVAAYYVGVSIHTTSPVADTVVLPSNPRGRLAFDEPVLVHTNDAGSPQTVEVADLDGDGDLDVIEGSDGVDRIVWHENVGGRLPNPPRLIGRTGPDLDEVHVEDLDGDGDSDVLAASYEDDTVAWFENLGGGVFSVRRVITDRADGASFVHADDMDRDGDPDVLTAAWRGNRIQWHENVGDGTFSAGRTITTRAGRAVHTADIDRDGDPDVLSAAPHDNKVAWYENLGDGTFSEQRVIDGDARGAVFVHAADFDGDGWIDVAAAAESDHAITWYRNHGGAGFSGARQVSTAVRRPTRLDVADLDGDGDIDVLSSSLEAGDAGWHENLGSGVFAERRIIGGGLEKARSVRAADITGDGRTDAIWAGIEPNQIAYAANAGIVATRPQKPPGRVVARGRLDGIAVSWEGVGDADGGSPVVRYVVVAVASIGGEMLTCEATGGENACDLVGVVPGLEYSVSVRAENAIGIGPESDAAKVRALCGAGASRWSGQPGRSATSGDSPEIATVTTPPAGDGEPRRPAVAPWEWKIGHSSAQVPRRYAVQTDDERVAACPSSGLAFPGETVETTLVAECPSGEEFEARVTVTVGASSLVVPWSVRCTDGNARLTAVELLQGPMVWRWGRDAGREAFASALHGRRAALVAVVEHDSAAVPDAAGSLLAGDAATDLGRLREPLTSGPAITASKVWETAFAFDLPGALHSPQHKVRLEIDPLEVLSERSRADNAATLQLNPERLRDFRIRFVPISSGVGEPSVDAEAYMTRIFDFFPLADDYAALTTETHVFTGEHWDQGAALDELLHRWNVEADGDEFWQGIYAYPLDGSSCGYAYLGLRVSVAAALAGGCPANIHAHELGHSLSLPHAPGGCGAGNPDPDYPYPLAGIGPRRGWLFSDQRFVEPDNGYADIMSYCSPNFISDYNYGKAMDFRRAPLAESPAPRAPLAMGAGGSADAPRSIAITGRVDAWGNWQVTGVAVSRKAPRPETRAARHRIELRTAADGRMLHTEPLRVLPSAHGAGAAWLARVPAAGIAAADQVVAVVLTDEGREAYSFELAREGAAPSPPE